MTVTIKHKDKSPNTVYPSRKEAGAALKKRYRNAAGDGLHIQEDYRAGKTVLWESYDAYEYDDDARPLAELIVHADEYQIDGVWQEEETHCTTVIA